MINTIKIYDIVYIIDDKNLFITNLIVRSRCLICDDCRLLITDYRLQIELFILITRLSTDSIYHTQKD